MINADTYSLLIFSDRIMCSLWNKNTSVPARNNGNMYECIRNMNNDMKNNIKNASK